VREYRLVRSFHPDFELKLINGCLAWEGETSVIPPPLTAPPLRFRIEYPSGFPVAAISVFPLSPDFSPEEWGHTWHRWQDGRICIVHPRMWRIMYTARDVIEKVVDWYYNYLAYKHGLITAMPDVGRAILMSELKEGGV